VLEAAAVLSEKCNVQFVLVGDGPQKQALLEQAKQRNLNTVRFLDPRPAYEMPALIAAADIVLVPLKMYIPGAVPSKLYEATASRRSRVPQ
jgi:glycosyltransferase involved in cell wall biosynthesis